MERISQCVGRFVAWQLITEILELLQLFSYIFDWIFKIVVIVVNIIASGWTRFGLDCRFLGEVLLAGCYVRVRLAGDARFVGMESHVFRVGRSCALLKLRVRLLNVLFVRFVQFFRLLVRRRLSLGRFSVRRRRARVRVS